MPCRPSAPLPAAPPWRAGLAAAVGAPAIAMGATTYLWVREHDPGWMPERPCWVFTHRELPGVPGDFVAAKFSVAP